MDDNEAMTAVNAFCEILETGNKLTDEQAKDLAHLMNTCPPVFALKLWAKLQENTVNLFLVHALVSKRMIAIALGEVKENRK